MRYTITDEIPPELHNLIGRKVTHAGIYTEARIKKASLAISLSKRPPFSTPHTGRGTTGSPGIVR
jgi:hypothetical protein